MTTLEQNCTSFYDGLGATRFQIDNVISSVTDGDLPSANVFVYKLGVADDPKSDTFLRIGTLQDITQLPLGRAAALISSATTFVAAGFSVTYADVATAVAAKQLIQSKIDQLIADWHLYTEQFVASSVTTLPLDDAGIVQAKKDAYSAAKAAQVTAAAAAAAAAAAFTAAQAAAIAATEKQTLRQEVYTQCVSTRDVVGSLTVAESAFRTAANTFLAAVQSGSATITSAQAAAAIFAAAVAAETTALQAPLTSLQSSLITSCSTKQGELFQASTSRVTAEAAVSSAQREALLAQQAATAAQGLVESTLATLLEVCPSVDVTVL